ncbi:MAG: sugar phosphate isomerase/epimerase family protein [Planctomycetota bacterium]
MQITWSTFPKFFRHLSAPQLAAMVREVGLDTTNAVIRDGYWSSKTDLAESLPAFCRTMADEGLKVEFCTAGFMPHEIQEDEGLLAVMAEAGIREFRMGYFQWDTSHTPAACLDEAKRQMEGLARQCERHGLRAVYQVHHGTLIPSAWAAWELVRDLPAEHVGVMLDPGNQTQEGWEAPKRSAHLLGKHLVSVGIKDGGVYRDGDKTGLKKGWRKTLGVTLNEGMVDWYDVARALKSVDFAGTFVYMPFYDQGDPAAMAAKLKDEVAYLRDVIAAVEAEEA